METETETKTANLFAALVKAQAEAHGIEKASENKFHRYRYASAEDVIAESKRVLAGSGLAFFPTYYRVSRTVTGEPPTLHCSYLVVHSSGESLEVESETPIVPEKGRPDDKAASTAKTYDLAYALRGLLLLPRVEEGADADARDDSEYRPQERKPGPPPQQQRPSPKEIQAEAAQQEDPWTKARAYWIRVLGRQMFADCCGCDVKEIDEYVPPSDPKKRAALKALLERARAELEEQAAEAAQTVTAS